MSILIILMIFTVLVLISGVVMMAFGGQINKKYSNKLMIARVTLQFISILVMAIIFVINSK